MAIGTKEESGNEYDDQRRYIFDRLGRKPRIKVLTSLYCSVMHVLLPSHFLYSFCMPLIQLHRIYRTSDLDIQTSSTNIRVLHQVPGVVWQFPDTSPGWSGSSFWPCHTLLCICTPFHLDCKFVLHDLVHCSNLK